MGFLVKKYTCPVIFLGCPGRPGLVFVGPCVSTCVSIKACKNILKMPLEERGVLHNKVYSANKV